MPVVHRLLVARHLREAGECGSNPHDCTVNQHGLVLGVRLPIRGKAYYSGVINKTLYW